MATRWSVSVLPTAQQDIDDLNESVRREAMELILDLGEDPFQGAVHLRGYNDYYRVTFHSNKYRILFQALRSSRKVLVVRVRPRSTAYRGMRNP